MAPRGREGRAALAAATAALRAGGATVEHGPVTTRGFPMHLTFVMHDPQIRLVSGYAFSASETPVSVNLFNPRHAIIDLHGDVRVTQPSGAELTVTARRGLLSLRWGDQGFARASLSLEDARITGRAPAASILAHLRPDPRDADDLQLAVSIDGWSETAPALRAGLVFAQGARRPVWEALFTPARVELLSLDGAATQATGELRLDAAGRLSGTVTIDGEVLVTP